MSRRLFRQRAGILALVLMTSAATLLPAAERTVNAREGLKPSAPASRTSPSSTTTPTADRATQAAVRTAAPATGTLPALSVTPAAPAPSATATANPAAGEKLTWMVLSGAGSSSSGGNFKLDVTVGQTASGRTSGGGFKLSQGFWQDFGSGSCCVWTRGNVNTNGIVDLADLSSLVNFLTGGGYVLPCIDEANLNASGIVDLADLSALVNYLTGGGYLLPSCP